MKDELEQYLDAIQNGDAYRVESVIKQGAAETTEKVWFVGANGTERGPFIRKRFQAGSGMGAAYQRIWEAQLSGKRFLHLPRVEEYAEDEEGITVVVEYVQGETLADVVYRCDPSVALAKDVFSALCDAVDELHTAFDPPLIHRDLKPSNVILSKGNVTLIDFGIARTFKEGSDSDTHCFGTRAYAAPEQFGFGQTTVHTDVFQLGLVLYYCLTEKTPDAQSRQLEWRSAGIPEPIRKVILQATAFNPDQRYRSVSELKRAFLAAAETCNQNPAWLYSAPLEKDRVELQPHVRTRAISSGSVVANVPMRVRVGASVQMEGVSGSAGCGVSVQQVAPVPQVPAGNCIDDVDDRNYFERIVYSLSRISRPIGMAWDIFLAVFLVLLFVGVVASIVEPTPQTRPLNAPLWLCVAYNLVLFFMMVVPAVFMVSDRRPLYSLVKPLRGIPLARQNAIAIAVICIGLLTAAVLYGAFPEYFPPSEPSS